MAASAPALELRLLRPMSAQLRSPRKLLRRLRPLLRRLLALGCAAAAAGARCDVGDAVQAYHAGAAVTKPATIARLDLSSASVVVSVNWDDGGLTHLDVPAAGVTRNGAACSFLADAAQAFTAVEGVPELLRLTGSGVSEANRLLIIDQASTCGALASAQHAAVTSAPQAPIGVQIMHFFDVVVNAVGTYKVCFWSGQSVNGQTVADPRSYATHLGSLVVTGPPTSTTTTTFAATSFSRRRGYVYESASLTVRFSGGKEFAGVTANPAGWNVNHPRYQDGTCRTCQREQLELADTAVVEVARSNRVQGALVAAPSATPGVLGDACRASTGGVAAAAPAPISFGTILMARRGACSFLQKARIASEGGFAGLLVVELLDDTQAPALPDMAVQASSEAEALVAEAQVPVPAWILPKDEGDVLYALLLSSAASSGGGTAEAVVEDLVPKVRLSSAQSDVAFGLRSYLAA
eukprot:TRINITY_DN33365_c0_g1_i1.p1 TRINITY_DN33365_c0_g1~~TRINITY_DN33365_c0_g1_i1.p1  ORF type:complete len:480 (-),score=98.93 TRINITY_DN33365_c0_g1_i1:86-1480(-)